MLESASGGVVGVDTEMQRDWEKGWWRSLVREGYYEGNGERTYGSPIHARHVPRVLLVVIVTFPASSSGRSPGQWGTCPNIVWKLDVAVLVEYLQPHPTIFRLVVVVVEHRRLKLRTHITQWCWPTSLDKGRGTAVGELEGAVWES